MHLTVTAFISFGAVALLLAMTASNADHGDLPLLLFLCGSVGSVVANYQRMAKLSQDADSVRSALGKPMVTIQLYVSPAVGGVFALILWAAFFSGLVMGDFFPTIDGTSGNYTNFHELMKDTHPHQFKDAMKGVFWCFLAGYSERFVPNILDRLAKQASANTQGRE